MSVVRGSCGRPVVDETKKQKQKQKPRNVYWLFPSEPPARFGAGFVGMQQSTVKNKQTPAVKRNAPVTLTAEARRRQRERGARGPGPVNASFRSARLRRRPGPGPRDLFI